MRNFIILLSLLLLLALLSCQSMQPSRTSVRSARSLNAEVWLRYLPETDQEAQFRLGVRPVPMDNGWTDLRIERDLIRIAYCGVNVVMVEAPPARLTNNEFLARFRHFCNKASEFKVKVVLSIAASDEMKLERANLVQYVESLDLHSLNSYLLKNELPVVLLDENLDVADAQEKEPVVLMRFGKELPSLPDSLPTEEIPIPADFIWCRTALCTPQGEWTIKRKRGGNLKKQLELIRQSDCKVVLVSSWNDYLRGDFVETNSLDGEAAMRILKNR